jgi:hypothetical protein
MTMIAAYIWSLWSKTDALRALTPWMGLFRIVERPVRRIASNSVRN